MAHIRRSTPTAGLEVILGIMPLDLHTQCEVVQAACRIWGQNRDKWDGIGRGHLRGYLFWSKRLLEQVDLNDLANFNKRAIKDLFHNRWRECWKHFTPFKNFPYREGGGAPPPLHTSPPGGSVAPTPSTRRLCCLAWISMASRSQVKYI